MKIVVFMENNQHGGLDTFCATLINAWPDDCDHFVFICNANHPGVERVRGLIHRPCEFVSHRIPLSWVLSKRLFGWMPFGFWRVSQPFLRILLCPLQFWALRRLFSRVVGDALLVLNGGYPGGETCRIANIAWYSMSGAADSVERRARNIHNFHNFAVLPRRGFGWYENAIDRRLFLSTGALISVSMACANSLSVRPAFHNNVPVTHIYNGIEGIPASGVAILDLRRSLGIGNAPLCLILANYEPRKGHRFLFEAFAKVAETMPNAHLVACGGGTAEDLAEIRAQRIALAPSANIHILGFVPGGSELIDQVDLVVISSQAFESFGLTAIEAMARGVPVVATRVGGLPEVVGEVGDAGYLVLPDDVDSYAARILELLIDPSLRREMGHRGRLRVAEHFTAGRMAEEYRRLLHRLLAPPDCSRRYTQQSEWHFLVRRIAEPGVARGLLLIAWSSVARRIGNRLFRLRRRYYPRPIRSVANSVCAQLDDIAIEKPSALPPGPRRLRLAVGHLCFEDWPHWESSFDDSEQYVSLHRWNWLLWALTDEICVPDFDWGVALMRSWLLKMSPLPRGDASESYTVGERIVNACLFTRHFRGEWAGLPLDVLAALEHMAVNLAARVEYHQGDLSGNHVLNNGRALLFAGHCAGNETLIALGRALLKERLPVLIEEGGFLREGSSHYQFLFTRWLLELRLLAEEKQDQETLELLWPVLPALVEACRFFLVEGADGVMLLPTIGDISPDCDPLWLVDLPNSPLAWFGETVRSDDRPARGWASLFPLVLREASEHWECPSLKKGPLKAYPKAGWYRLDWHDWVAILRAESSSGAAIASHAHHDSGSLVLFYRGREVLVDPGRRDYTGSAMGRYGISGEAHSGVLIDGRPPMLSRGDRLLPNCYREANCAVDFCVTEQGVKVGFEHDGFTRLAVGVTKHRREFLFGPREVLISDFFDGRGMHCVECRFQMPVEADAADLTLVAAPQEFHKRTLITSIAPFGGWRFPAYGVEAPAVTHLFSGNFQFPALFRYRLSFNEE